MYPAVPMLLRTCTQNYRIPDSDFTVERGTVVYIPIYGLHHDAEYYPDPQKFDPERFSENNKQLIPHYAYLPFGEGPKICIGEHRTFNYYVACLISIRITYTININSWTIFRHSVRTNATQIGIS